jgi:hypothetical protein
MIWRRLVVRSDNTIADLHYIIQIAFAWTDYEFSTRSGVGVDLGDVGSNTL